MNISNTDIEGLLIIEPQVHKDDRGYFFESYRSDKLAIYGVPTFVQDNQAYSTYGTIRGLHFQLGDAAQAKLVRVISGEVLDVAVDLRPGSRTFGQHYSIILNELNNLQFFVPRGFAHGYIVLSDEAIFAYKCDNYYNKSAEGGIRYDDPDLHIDWQVPLGEIVLSQKDLILPSFKSYSQSNIR